MTAEADDVHLLRNSGLFDETYYRGHCARGIGDAVEHYLNEGWLANFDPGPTFSTRFYLTVNADVRACGANPLVHYLRFGAREGRRISSPSLLVKEPERPTEDEWGWLIEGMTLPHPSTVEVDVIVPVYKGLAETLRCIYSVLAARQTTPYRLIVLDDCTPDPELRAALEVLAAKSVIELHRCLQNFGFVRTCNLGMSLHPSRDVVLLNSDTAVYNDWLDRLRDAAYRGTRIATVTPFSNNAEICSYPITCEDNILELELSDADLDRLAAASNAGGEVDLPTGVGFCMYIRRACLDEIGDFNVQAFGKGYGEENDFCQRAERARWRNILATDVFVRHYGGVSFGAEKRERVGNAIRRVEELNPGYLQAVGEFCRDDPAAPWRESLDLARLRRIAHRGAILIVTHTWGGGTERHVSDLEALLLADGRCTFRCTMSETTPDHIIIRHQTASHVPNMPTFGMAMDIDRFAVAIEAINVRHLHFQHFAGMPANSVAFFRSVCRRNNLTYDVTLHDYMSVCPRIDLIDRSGVYCGEPGGESCEACIQRDGSPFGKPVVWEWRERFHTFLEGARRIFVPSPDVAERLKRYFADLAFDVRPHPRMTEPAEAGKIFGPRSRRTSRTIAIIGAIGPHKGSALLLECVTRAAQIAPELRFVIVGYTDRDHDFACLHNIRILGKYAENQLQGILAKEEAHLCWFSSVWPETFSYTLSAVLEARLFPIAFDLGAIARRIRDAGWGHLMPMNAMFDVDEIIATFQTLTIPAAPGVNDLLPRIVYPDPLRTYYGFEASGPYADDRVRENATTPVAPHEGRPLFHAIAAE